MSIESIRANTGAQRLPALDGAANAVARPSQGVASGKAPETSSASVQRNTAGDRVRVADENQPAKEEAAVKKLADFVTQTRPELNFSVDEASGIRVVKIIDTATQEVIRQFPSEEAIQLAQALDKLQGLLVKDQA